MSTCTEKTVEAALLTVIALILARSLIGMAEDLSSGPKELDTNPRDAYGFQMDGTVIGGKEPDAHPRDAYGFRMDGPVIGGGAEHRPSAERSAAACSGSPRGC